MFIMKEYYDSSHRCDFGRMPDSGQKMRLRSEDMTLIVYPDSGHNS
jgi:hypothetical protein